MTSARLPIIGLAPVRVRDASGGTLVRVRQSYIDAVVEAGGVPVVLAEVDPALVPSFVAGVDALILPGGRDIPPSCYGEPASPELEEVLEQDLAATYLALARSAVEQDLPTLGICLGHQVMNVALGGTLVQHLRPQPGAPLHRGGGQVDVRHPVRLRPSSRLGRELAADTVEVVSHHHQAIDRLAPGLEATGWSPEGLIEAVEHARQRFFVGVQWHPERQPGEPSSLRLFAALVREAGRAAMDSPTAAT